jgi:glycosyltransferase involved in cell wall biosynthesis
MPISLFQQLDANPGLHHKMQDKHQDRMDPDGERRHVLMVGPGPNVRGGINSVIAAYMQSKLRQQYACDWLSTYDDRGPFRKIAAALRAYTLGPVLISRADIVHIHGVFRKSFARKLPLILMAKAMRKRVIFHVHAAIHEGSFTGPLAPVIRWVLTSVDKVIVLSPIFISGIQSHCPRANVISLPNPTLLPRADSMRPAKKNEPRILFLGRPELKKGFRDLLKAMPAVIALVPTARLVVAGDGDIDSARPLAEELGISASVTFLGFVRGERKTRELQRAAVLCLPSYDEGVPMALLEAMSHGIPVVATPVGGVPDLIRSGENGLLISPGDTDGLARAIVSLLTDSYLSARIGDAGFASIERLYSLDHVCTLLGGIYASLSSKSTPGSVHAASSSRA